MNELEVIDAKAVTTTENRWQELFQEFISYIDVRDRTIETYRKVVKQFILYLQETSNSHPTRETVKEWREALKEAHKPSTVQTYITSLRAFFKYLAGKGYYPNIVQDVKGAKIQRGFKKDYLTTAQSHTILETLKQRIDSKGLRDFAIISLMLTTGVRTIEVVRANIEDMRTVGDSVSLFVQGKGRDDRTESVRLAPQVEKAIRDYLKTRPNAKETDPLFTSNSNHNISERLTTRSISRLVKETLREVGLNSDKLTAHSLRHTAGTLALLNGHTVQEVQQVLRHSNINTTMIYAHNIDRVKNTSELSVANAIF